MQSSSRKFNILHELDMAIRRKVTQRSKDIKEKKDISIKFFTDSVEKKKSSSSVSHKSKSKQKLPGQKGKLTAKEQMNKTVYLNNEAAKSGQSEKRFNSKKMDKLVNQINYVLSSAERMISFVDVSTFDAEFAVKLFISDKDGLLAQLENLKTEDMGPGTAQKASSGSPTELQVHALKAQNNSLKKETMLLEAQITKLKEQKSHLNIELITIKSSQQILETENPKAYLKQTMCPSKQADETQQTKKGEKSHEYQQLKLLKEKQVERMSEVLKSALDESYADRLLQNIDKWVEVNRIKASNAESGSSKKKAELETIISALERDYCRLLEDIRRDSKRKKKVMIAIQEKVVPLLAKAARGGVINCSLEDMDEVEKLETVVKIMSTKKSASNSENQSRKLLQSIEGLKRDNEALMRERVELLDSMRELNEINSSIKDKNTQLKQEVQDLQTKLRQTCAMAQIRINQAEKADTNDLIEKLKLAVREKHQQKGKQGEKVNILKQSHEREVKKIQKERKQMEDRYMLQLEELRSQMEKLQQQNKEMQGRLQDVKLQLMKSQKKNKGYEKEIEQIREQIEREIGESTLKLHEELVGFRSDQQRFKKELARKQEDAARLQSVNAEHQEQIRVLKNEIESLKDKCEQLKESYRQQKNGYLKKIDDLSIQNERSKIQSASKEEQISSLKSKLSANSEKDSKNSKLNSQLELLTEELEQTLKQLDLKESNLSTLFEEKENIRRDKTMLSQQIRKLADRIGQLEEQKASALKENESLKENIKELKITSQKYHQIVRELELQIGKQQKIGDSASEGDKSKLQTQISQLRYELENNRSLREHEISKATMGLQQENRCLVNRIDSLNTQIEVLNATARSRADEANQLKLMVEQSKLKVVSLELTLEQLGQEKIHLIQTNKIQEKEMGLIRREIEKLRDVEGVNNNLKEQYEALKRLQGETEKQNRIMKMKQEPTMNLIKIIVKKILNIDEVEHNDIESLLEEATNVVRQWKLSHPPKSATPKKHSSSHVVNSLSAGTTGTLDFSKSEREAGKLFTAIPKEQIEYMGRIEERNEQESEQKSRLELVNGHQLFSQIHKQQEQGNQQDSQDDEFEIGSAKLLVFSDIKKNSILDQSDIISNEAKSRVVAREGESRQQKEIQQQNSEDQSKGKSSISCSSKGIEGGRNHDQPQTYSIQVFNQQSYYQQQKQLADLDYVFPPNLDIQPGENEEELSSDD